MSDDLTWHIEDILTALGGRTAVSAARRADTASRTDAAESVSIRADEVFPAASLAKVGIAVEVVRRASLGQFALDERFDTSAEPRVGGGGLLDYLDPATRLTLRELCLLMLAVSDNTAANFLLDLVGMGEVNETLSRLNLTHTRMARHFMDFAARRAGRDNTTSAQDMLALLSLIRGDALPGARTVRELLLAQQVADEIKQRLPPETPVALKTGSLDASNTEGAVYHAAGFMQGLAGSAVFCVLTADQADPVAARAAAGRCVRLLWDAWCAGQ